VLDGAHPHCGALPILGDDEEYNELVRHLGVRCTVLEKEFAQHPEKVRPKRAKTVTGKRTSEERPGMSPRRLSAYGAAGAMFAVGMFVGGAWATAAALNREATWHLGVNSIAYAYSAHGQHLSPAATYGSAFFNMMEGLIREQGPYFVPT
jgi:hypothetical protein